MNTDEIVIASGIVIYRMANDQPEFLLLKNASHGTWGFPKGHMNPGEEIQSCAMRECEEEIGLKPDAVFPDFMKISNYTVPDASGERRLQKRVHYFLAQVQERTISLSPEHARHVWETRLKARRRLQFDSLREILDCAYSTVTANAGKAHPDTAAARTLLEEKAVPDAMWRKHCIKVSQVSRQIAAALIDADPTLPVDPESVEAAGLLHDIGRYRDQGIGHPQAGMELLRDAGMEHLAKPCISHWLKGRSRSRLANDPFFTPAKLDALFNAFDLETFTLSEKIVSIADSLVQHDEPVRLAARYYDARARYGDSKWMRENERISEQLIAELEEILKGSLYALLQL